MRTRKKIYLPLLGLLVLALFSFGYQLSAPIDTHKVYGPEEVLEYRLHYGFITAGEARVEMHPQLYKVNNKVCYKATIFGRTTGTFAMAMEIKDTWGSFIDTASRIPQGDFREIVEGNCRFKEYVQLNHETHKASVERIGQEGKVTHQYDLPSYAQDIVGGAYYLRTINYNALKIGQIITVPAFFEDQTYQFSVRYMGKERIKSEFGKINAIRLVPVMPDNEVFDGGNSISVWISDDKNKIPIRMEARMFVGKVAVDLKHYQGLANPIKFEK